MNYIKYHSAEDEEEVEEKEIDESVILVTTYQTQHASYFTVLLSSSC